MRRGSGLDGGCGEELGDGIERKSDGLPPYAQTPTNKLFSLNQMQPLSFFLGRSSSRLPVDQVLTDYVISLLL